MKKIITFLTILFICLWTIPSWGQASIQRIVRIRDNNTNSMADVLQLQLNFNTNIWGLTTRTGNYFYDATGANWRWWNGIQSATNLTALPRAPFTLDLPYFYSISSTDLELWRGDPMNSDDVDAGTEMPYVGAFGMFLNESTGNWDRDTGDAMNSDAVPNTSEAPRRAAFGHIYLIDGAVWARDGGETADGGNISAARTGAYRLTLNYGWNGTNWSPGLIGAVGEWQMTDVATRPGEDAGNDRRKIEKTETAVYNPAVTFGTAVDDAGTDIVCASTYVLNLPNWSVFVKNAGGGTGNAFNDVDVQISYDGTNWSSETSTACDALTSGNSARCYKGSNESAAYVRVVASCAGGNDTTADCVIQGNKN